MLFPKRLQRIPALVLIALARIAYGAEPAGNAPATNEPAETVTIVAAAETAPSCKDLDAGRARELADQAFHDGAYRRAADCYLIAGKPDLADLALIRAASATSADTSRKLAANSAALKAQARQLATAFRGH